MKNTNMPTTQISLTELFSSKFFQSHTSFMDLNDFFIKAGYNIQSEADIEAIPQDEIDSFVKLHTKFENFHDLHKHAVAEYLKGALNIK